MPPYRVGIDIGGTFTDLVAVDEETLEIIHLKKLTTPQDPVRCFIDILLDMKIRLKNIDILIHATTLGTNMFLGQTGLEKPRILFITNRGFRDVIEIGRQNRPDLYNLFFTRPEPLVPRSYRLGVKGRIGPRGEEVESLNEEEIRDIARRYCGKVDVFVISFLHSYINPIHEKRVREIILDECPDKIVVASYEVDSQPKEYERASTTLINAILRPMLSRYLERISRELKFSGFGGRFLIMRSDGGVSGIEHAIEKPAAFIESGPAAGAVAVAYLSRELGVGNALGFDMGGTTAKASAIINGDPEVISEYEVGGRVHMGRILRGSGYPLRIPHIDLAEVSAGGGTVAWVDEGGALRVGPMSVGADPGPACYDKGGDKPTITDANLVLGRLPKVLAGGEIRLNEDLAYSAIENLGDELGLDPVEAAYGVIRIANYTMARAIRLVSVERGHDPRDFILFAFGGAGPLHAADMSDIGFRKIIIPPLPGVFSAFGLITTDFKHDYMAGIIRRVNEIDDNFLNRMFIGLEERAVDTLLDEGVSRGNIRLFRYLEMRYWGQAYELRVPYRGSIEEALTDFHRIHEARYGYSMPEEDVEIVTARVFSIGLVVKPRLRRLEAREHVPNPIGKRMIYMGESGWVKSEIFLRERLKPGASVDGPALIEEDDSTTLIPPGFRAQVDEYLNIHIWEVDRGGG